jgi:class 3 adenylate cyclase
VFISSPAVLAAHVCYAAEGNGSPAARSAPGAAHSGLR